MGNPDLAYNQPFFGQPIGTAFAIGGVNPTPDRAEQSDISPGTRPGHESRLNEGAPPITAAHIHVSDRNPQRQEAL
ncbi:hypothetical protein [Trinickia sp.]|uniref:hypothetical protein n=1 Tax=Trinickia sp. TaxID=2571163 RepID=UPI003F81E17B